MKKLVSTIALIGLLAGCSSKKPDINGEWIWKAKQKAPLGQGFFTFTEQKGQLTGTFNYVYANPKTKKADIYTSPIKGTRTDNNLTFEYKQKDISAQAQGVIVADGLKIEGQTLQTLGKEKVIVDWEATRAKPILGNPSNSVSKNKP